MTARPHFSEMLLALRLHGKSDALRAKKAFSEDIEATNAVLFNPTYSKRAKVQAYRKWLEQNQPCVFGRIAAKNKNVFICLLEEREILAMKGGDNDLHDTLQDYRQVWKRHALEGLVSSFVIVVVAPSLVTKQPDDGVKEIARRLLELYMEIDRIDDDTYHTQREYVFLRRVSDGTPNLLKFSTLPNIFCAQGDRRWWHDHRTPGGLMVTSNALGHFMYSRGRGQLDAAAKTWALENAMRTINNAHVGSRKGASKFCPATNLVPAAPGESSPLKPTSELARYSADHYEGYFHTDHLIPSVYFEPKQRREPPPRYADLTFRYIYDESADPEEHRELMTGVRASWYDVRRNMDRLPDFANPEAKSAFAEGTRGRLAQWLEQRLRSRML
jgi:hypothetical protein